MIPTLKETFSEEDILQDFGAIQKMVDSWIREKSHSEFLKRKSPFKIEPPVIAEPQYIYILSVT